LVSYAAGLNTRPVFPDDSHEQYGGRLTGWLTPAVTGDYEFFLSSDDASQFWLSTDATEANLQLVAEQTGCCNVFTEQSADTPVAYTTAAPIHLVAGAKYWLQALWKEGGGGDYCQVAWRKVGDTTPAGNLLPLTGSVLSSLADSAGASVTITNQPQNLSVAENSLASFSIGVAAVTPYLSYPGGQIKPAYQWYKNGAPVDGATSASYSIPVTRAATDNNAKIKCVVSVPGVVQTSAEVTLTITTDSVAPTVFAANGSPAFTKATIAFSEPVDAATATNAANYSINGLTVSAVKISNLTNVVLTTSKQATGTPYTITINAVKDLSGNVIAANTKASFISYVYTAGVVEFDYWANISGTAVQSLKDDPRYPDFPDQASFAVGLNSRTVFPDDSHENYGATLTGLITPAETGDYDFFIKSDDASQLWISTNDDPANAALIAEETGCCNPFEEPGANQTTQAPVHLVAGTKYWIQAILKEGGGGDFVQVAWRQTTDSTAAADLLPIPGEFFSGPVPPEGAIISSTPAPDAKDASPFLIQLQHVDGVKPLTSDNVVLKLDGTTVTPTVSKTGGVATVTYKPSPALASQSTHQVTVTYPSADGGTSTYSWSFTVGALTKDLLSGYIGIVKGTAAYSTNAAGHTGKAGDYAINLPASGGGWVYVADASFLNQAATNDEMSFSIWINHFDVSNSSAFWANSASAGRGFQGHTPWGDDTIYFDTMGCCDGGAQRISANINTFDPYNAVGNDTWWKQWHHFVFTKKADQKNVYIDGLLFLNGSSTNPLLSDFTDMGLGTDGTPGGDFLHGLMDDFAVFSTEISADDAAKLAAGTSPKDLTGEKLIAYWNFDDATGGGGGNTDKPTLSIARDSSSAVKITYTGTLQASDTVSGPWTDVATPSPATITDTTGMRFFRAKK
ncbi:MAG TPA: PA14 domain-containing protein, partial [Verrucomicrobiae bacterium]|nr:PA14 domain-containing protein [Verrucomicrobiae bacterium]